MPQLAQAALQAAADLAKTLGLGYLAKQLGHELLSATEPFGMYLGLMSKDQLRKPRTFKQGHQLTEQACMAYHASSSLSGFVGYWFGDHNLAL
jgi:hypothetical protein